MTTRTEHSIDTWTYTMTCCDTGRLLHDDMEAALDSVRAWRRMTGEREYVRCPHTKLAGDNIKAYSGT